MEWSAIEQGLFPWLLVSLEMEEVVKACGEAVIKWCGSAVFSCKNIMSYHQRLA